MMLGRRAAPSLRATSRRLRLYQYQYQCLHHHAPKLQAALPLPTAAVSCQSLPRFNLSFRLEPSAQDHHKQALHDAAKLPEATDTESLHPEDWQVIFHSCAQDQTDPTRWVDALSRWIQHTTARKETASSPKEDEAKHSEIWTAVGSAIHCCIATHHEQHAVTLFEEVTKHQDIPCTDEAIFVDVMQASTTLKNNRAFKSTYRAMVAAGVAREAGISLTIRWARDRVEFTFLNEVLDDAFATEYATKGVWRLSVRNYNTALKCFIAAKQWHDAEALCLHMLDKPDLKLDHMSMMLAIESHRAAAYRDVLELVRRFIEDRHLAPNVQVYTSLLAICARRRLFKDAAVLWDTMRAQQVELDSTAYATMSAIYAASGHLTGVVGILREMSERHVAPTPLFFEIVLQPLCRFDRIDRCLALLDAMRNADVMVPLLMYETLVRLGTKNGVVQQTLSVIQAMARDGFEISSELLLPLVRECHSSSDAAELAHVFAELHTGGVPPNGTPIFSDDVYREVHEQCTRWAPHEAQTSDESNQSPSPSADPSQDQHQHQDPSSSPNTGQLVA